TVACPLYPPGAHLVYAAEMRLVGWSHHAAFLAVNCLWGAVVAPCAMLLAHRIVPRLPFSASVGVVLAVWYPLLAFAGFFSSEQPYAGAIALSAFFVVRLVERAEMHVAVAAAVATSVAYLVRPQIVVTIALLGVVAFAVFLRRRRTSTWRVAPFLVAAGLFSVTVGWGIVRFHHLGHRWGLISDNGALTRLWADTNYSRVVATWHAPDGEGVVFEFDSPPKAAIGDDHVLAFDGYVGAATAIDRARRNEVFYETPRERVARWASNVTLLFRTYELWPESVHHDVAWRKASDDVSRRLLLGLLPFALVGVVSSLRRRTPVLVVCAAHVVTMAFVAAFFFGEQRYRVPYDVFLLLLAFEGVRWLGTDLAAALARRTRARLPDDGLRAPD
ncbi:MAG TPA: hypothetical protein VIY73_06800, partial [Polyangiaceae bacterium]